MWDLRKTLAHVAGVRKREALGLPPFHMTDEERAMMARFRRGCAEDRAKRSD